MQQDIFKLFKKSIEPVQVKRVPRGELNIPAPTFDVTLSAIVKRRKLMATSVENSEDFNNNTTVHFKPTDSQYIAVGDYVQIDGDWHSIEQVRQGKDFDQGKVKFLYVFLANDIVEFTEEVIWQ